MSPSLIEIARGIAERAHAGQRDKLGVPYIEHPAAVARYVQQLADFARADEATREAAVCAAWLHDVIEDTDETVESLARVGLPPVVVAAVVALTRTAEVAADDYYRHIREVPVALLVKTADIAHNLQPDRVAKLSDETRARLQRKYAHALGVLGVDPAVMAALHSERGFDGRGTVAAGPVDAVR
jgi:(p)ppGpp synthase/HD superfamily hydrolase